MADATSWSRGELLSFDLETTGVDCARDAPVSYALVRLTGAAVVATDSALVDPGRPVPPEATAVHGITGRRVREEGVPLAMAVSHLAHQLLDASRRGVPLVGMKLDFDLTMLDVLCRRHLGRGLCTAGFAGPVVDVLVLDRRADPCRRGPRTLSDLCRVYGVALEAPHQAAADALAAAQVAVAMCDRHGWIPGADAAALHGGQVRWHRRWATSYDRWRRAEGLAPLDPAEFDWPIVAGPPAPAGLVAIAG